MNDLTPAVSYGSLVEPTTLRLERLLPGPIDRVWAYLTQGDLRRQWLASGEMKLEVGAEFELTWRNDELTDPPGTRPDGFGAEHSMTSRILAVDPPHKLAFTFGTFGEVTFDLEPRGSKVLLAITHRRVTDPAVLWKVSAGWHAHVDVLAAKLAGLAPEAFWDRWLKLKADYEERLSG